MKLELMNSAQEIRHLHFCDGLGGGKMSFKKARLEKPLIDSEFFKAVSETCSGFPSWATKMSNDVEYVLHRPCDTGVVKPISRSMFENGNRINRLMQSFNHAVRPQLVRGDLLKCTFSLPQNSDAGVPSNDNFIKTTATCFVLNFVYARIKLQMRMIYECRYCPRTSLQCFQIGIFYQFRGGTVLCAHYENRYPQCCYRADRLDPSRPCFSCQAYLIANDSSGRRASNEHCGKNYLGFLHNSIQSCLKVILA